MEENLQEIETLIQEYPYYTLLYFKRAKLLADNKNETYKNALKLASVYAPNRRKLQEFIENPTDYRKQIVTHPEWLLSEEEEKYVEKEVSSMNDEELIKEILTIEEPNPVPETPIVKEVHEVEDILSHFTEQDSAQNDTIKEIEELKQIIQQNQEKARLALFQANHKDVHTPTTNALLPTETIDTEVQEEESIPDEEVKEEEINPVNETVPETTEEFTAASNPEIEEGNKESEVIESQQEPVSISLPKIKEWFEQELKAVRSEKESEVLESEVFEQTSIEENIQPTQEEVDLSAEGYISWLDELLSMQHNTKKTKQDNIDVDKKAFQNAIIDRFLENQPKINKPNFSKTSTVKDKTETQTVEYEDIASETLAKIFVMQKQYDRAIRIYNVLISKNPSQKEHYEALINEVQNKMK